MQRNPDKWPGASAQIIARQPLGDSKERTRIQPPSFRTFITSHASKVGTVAPARPHSGLLPPRGCVHGPPQESAHSRTFSWSICCVPPVVLGSSGNVLSCLSGTCDIFWGAFQAFQGEHVILNTCSFCLLVASKYRVS